MSKRGYTIVWPDPDPGGPTEKHFTDFLNLLPSQTREAVSKAILSLERDPRPTGHFETNPEFTVHFLRKLPGAPFKKVSDVVNDIVHAKDHLTVSGITLVYNIDEKRELIWLLAIRNSL